MLNQNRFKFYVIFLSFDHPLQKRHVRAVAIHIPGQTGKADDDL